jgi:T5SS/PEP-CTERM-associated repeat protein
MSAVQALKAARAAGVRLGIDDRDRIAQGSGTLTMTGGAVSAAGAMTLGEEKGSSGKMTLSDATLSITGNLNIGEAGSGSAIVQLGSVLKSKAIEIGGALGARGSLTISGAGTSVTTGEITIGAGGTGTLKVTSGGLLTTNGDASIGSVALGAIVSASLDTGGEWQLRRKTGTMSGCTDPEGSVVEHDISFGPLQQVESGSLVQPVRQHCD